MMMIEPQYIWLGIMVFLLLAEAATAGLTTIWFAGGALAAVLAALLGAGIIIQLFLFTIVSFLLLFFTRPLVMKYMNKNVTKTNVNSLIGEKAVVTFEINNLAQTGQVKINDIDWTARSSSEDIVIPAKTVVVIDAVKGVKLIVHPYGKE